MKEREHCIFRFYAVSMLIALWSFGANAQNDALPSVDEIINKLNAAVPAQNGVARPNGKTRGIVVTDDVNRHTASTSGSDQTLAASKTTQRVEKVEVVSYSESRIQFEFGSDRLTEFSKRVLDVFAAAIQSPALKALSFVVEGHTDGVGSDQYNLNLSRKRAITVARYLADVRGVDRARLSARGKGKRELVNPTNPAAAENRRVAWLPQRANR